jgi:Rps23 Pro-64 3,4-dihydroxylase Tpa1-like proline 4-hydroxylase
MPTHFILPSLTDTVPHPLAEVALVSFRDKFLSIEDKNSLLEFARSRASDFQPTSVTTNSPQYPDHRNSLVLYDVPDWMRDRVLALVPDVLNELNYPPFPISRVEAQLTAHNDNNYYKIHNDNGCDQTNGRKLTFVYYFYQEPKRFTGGNLIIYGTKIQQNRPIKTKLFQVFEPVNNNIVFFLSSYLHEVRPVVCPSKAFEDSRFTVNGWIS